MLKFEDFSGPHFPYSVRVGKIRTKKNSELGHFSLINKVISNFFLSDIYVRSRDTRTQLSHTIDERSLVP